MGISSHSTPGATYDMGSDLGAKQPHRDRRAASVLGSCQAPAATMVTRVANLHTSPWIGRGSAHPTSRSHQIFFGLHLPVAASVRHFSLLSTTTRLYTALYYPYHPAVLSKHGH